MDMEASLAPTDMPRAAVPGEPRVFSLGPALPAATTVTKPESMALFIATEVAYKGSVSLRAKRHMIDDVHAIFNRLIDSSKNSLVYPPPQGPNTLYAYKSTSGATLSQHNPHCFSFGLQSSLRHVTHGLCNTHSLVLPACQH